MAMSDAITAFAGGEIVTSDFGMTRPHGLPDR
jgi:hypothetical protein